MTTASLEFVSWEDYRLSNILRDQAIRVSHIHLQHFVITYFDNMVLLMNVKNFTCCFIPWMPNFWAIGT